MTHALCCRRHGRPGSIMCSIVYVQMRTKPRASTHEAVMMHFSDMTSDCELLQNFRAGESRRSRSRTGNRRERVKFIKNVRSCLSPPAPREVFSRHRRRSHKFACAQVCVALSWALAECGVRWVRMGILQRCLA